MKITAVIAEFNPFHNGHKYLLEECRVRTQADAVLAVLSGDYVERGAPAIADGYFRAGTALLQGADLVLFLPSRFVLRSAEGYAYAAVSLLDSLGCVDSLAFGSECGDLSLLRECAQSLSEETDLRKEILRKNLREGLSFPKARALAYPEYASLLDSPNNILGIEYLKALYSMRSEIEPCTVKRIGPGHNDTTPGKEYASASAIRNLLADRSDERQGSSLSPVPHRVCAEDPFPVSHCASSEELLPAPHRASSEGLLPMPHRAGSEELLPIPHCLSSEGLLPMPEMCREALLAYCEEHRLVTSDDFSQLLGIRLMELGSREDLLLYPDIDRDLAGSIFSNRFAYTGFTAYADLIKSKAYTMTRIHRALLRIALGLPADGAARPLFARAAGFTAQGARLLAEIKKRSTIPILTKNSESEILSGEARGLYDEEIRLANIYRLIREGKSGRPPQNVLKTGLIRV